jgi:transposase
MLGVLMSTGRFEEAPVSETYAGPQIVGLDLHRRRTVMVRLTPSGERLEVARFASDPQVLADQIAKAGAAPRVVLEATYGWYWAADVLAAAGAEVHLAHPLGVKGFAYRRVKNDVRDAADLADLLRMQRLPEAWIAPPPVRAQRELVRHRHKLRQVCSRLKSGAHAVLAKNGVLIARSDMFGIDGRRQLSRLVVPEAFRIRLDSQLRLVDILEDEIADLDNRIAAVFGDDTGYRTVQRIGGIGPVLGAVLRAEIGDITRFRSPARLNSWAGLTPRHRESDTTVHRGSITKQGSRLVRRAAIEAVQHAPADTPMRNTYQRIVARRGPNAGHIARVAAARELLTRVFYALRDGHVRRLAPHARPDNPTERRHQSPVRA